MIVFIMGYNGENSKLDNFLKENIKKNRLFILGDTGSGKSTGVLNYYLSSEKPTTVFYISTRKADLTEKKEFISKYQEYMILFHDSPKSIDITNSFEATDNSGIKENKTKKALHLMTVEKALFYFVANVKNKSGNLNPDLFILDEIDSINENSNYEILTAFLNSEYPNVKIVYISAVVNSAYVKSNLSDFFMLENEKSYFDLGKNNKQIVPHFFKMKSSLSKEIEMYFDKYSKNRISFGSTVFLVPSINFINAVINNKKLMALPIFVENKTISNELNKFGSLNPLVKMALKHNFGIIHSGIDAKERKLVLDFFNSGKIKILVSTNSIERGINIKTKSLFLFEIPNIHWDNQQIINFYGRINRIKEGKNDIGYFYFISSYRENYDFNILKERNEKIKSCLSPERAFMFSQVFPNMSNRFIDKKMSNKIKDYSEYKDYADAIAFSLMEDTIFPNKEKFDALFSNIEDNNDTLDRKSLVREILNITNQKQIQEYLIKYMYYKAIEKARVYELNKEIALNIVGILCNELAGFHKLQTFKADKFNSNDIKKERDIAKRKILNNSTIEDMVDSIFSFQKSL